MMALACVRLIEARLQASGLPISGATAMKSMHNLHSCLCYTKHKRKPRRIVKEPNALQAQISAAVAHRVTGSGVLQKISG